jgi:hypothetical protein
MAERAPEPYPRELSREANLSLEFGADGARLAMLSIVLLFLFAVRQAPE